MTASDDPAGLAERFEEQRARLRAVAYRMLGSASEADDAVQDAWLRVSRADTREVDNLNAWLTQIVARVSLSMLRRRTTRREEPLEGQRPAVTTSRRAEADPEQEAVLADSVGLALLVVLDTLTPAERLAFVLHDMFAVPFDEIARMLDRSPEAARQLASRARRRVKGSPPGDDVDLARQRRVVDAYLAAARDGDFEALVALLHPEVVLHADAAAGPTPEPVVVRGPRRVAYGATAAGQRSRWTQPALIDGTVGLVMVTGGRLVLALAFVIVDDLIERVDVVAEPGRLDGLEIGVLDRLTVFRTVYGTC